MHMRIIDPHPALGRHEAPFARFGFLNLQVQKILRIRSVILYNGWVSFRDAAGIAGSCAAGRVVWWCWKDSRSAECFSMRPYSRISLNYELIVFGRDSAGLDRGRARCVRRLLFPRGSVLRDEAFSGAASSSRDA